MKIFSKAFLNKYKLLGITLAVISLVSYASAQKQDYQLTLEEAIELALSKNFSIRLEAVSTDIAEQAIEAERGAFDPRLNISYEDSDSSTQQGFDPTTGIRDNPYDSETKSISASVGGVLPIGTRYSVSATSLTGKLSTNNYNEDVATNVGLNITQPLLRGGWTSGSLLVKIARKGHEMSEAQFRHAVINTLTEVYVAYNRYYSAIQSYNVQKRSRDITQEFLDDNRKRVSFGSMAPIDLVLSESQLALREESVIIASRLLDSSENYLKQLISDESLDLTGLNLLLTPPPIAAVGDMVINESLQLAMNNRADYQRALLQYDQSELNVSYKRNQRLPGVDLFASYGINGIDRTRGSSWDQTRNRDHDSVTFGVAVDVPFPNRYARSQLITAELQENRADLYVKQLERAIHYQVDDAIGRVLTARQRDKAAKLSTDLAVKSLQAEEKKFKVGRSETFFVIQAQNELSRAELRQIAAEAELNSSIAEYYQTLGTTLTQYGIVLD